MATNGVTSLGFVRPRLPEIRADITAALTLRLQSAGFTEPPETRPDSLFGLIIDTFAERETAVWEQAEGVYFSMYPDSASGIQLDRAVSFTGVSRLLAQPSSIQQMLYGLDGTVVPGGSQVRNSVTSSLWQTADDVTIGLGAVGDVLLRPIVSNGTLYRVTIDGTNYDYTSDASATLPEVLTGMLASLAVSAHTATSDGATVRIVSAGESDFALQVSGSIQIIRFGTPVVMESIEDGPITAQIGDLTQIVTLVPGWNTTENLQVASLGRLAETDAALRTRYRSGVYALGAATLPAIQANLEARVSGVQTVRVFENNTDNVDAAGRPPHSIHVVAQGGLDSEIAQAIFQYKAAGIDTYGAIVSTVTDTEGIAHTIKFDRPVARYIWVKAVLSLLPASEETFPPDGFAQVRTRLLAAGSALGVGQDVIWQRLLQAALIQGVAQVNLTLAATSTLTAPAPGDYAAANLTIADFQIARFDASRIFVS